jgi:hypothetical protein
MQMHIVGASLALLRVQQMTTPAKRCRLQKARGGRD